MSRTPSLIVKYHTKEVRATIHKVTIAFQQAYQKYLLELPTSTSDIFYISDDKIKGSTKLYFDLMQDLTKTKRLFQEDIGIKYCLVLFSCLHVYLIHCGKSPPSSCLEPSLILKEANVNFSAQMNHIMYSTCAVIAYKLQDDMYKNIQTVDCSRTIADSLMDEYYGVLRRCITHTQLKMCDGKAVIHDTVVQPQPPFFSIENIDHSVREVDCIQNTFGILYPHIFYLICPESMNCNFYKHLHGTRSNICLKEMWSFRNQRNLNEVIETPCNHGYPEFQSIQLRAMCIAYVCCLLANRTNNTCLVNIFTNADVFIDSTKGSIHILEDKLMAVFDGQILRDFQCVFRMLDYMLQLTQTDHIDTSPTYKILGEIRCLLKCDATESDFNLLRHTYLSKL